MFIVFIINISIIVIVYQQLSSSVLEYVIPASMLVTPRRATYLGWQ